jgi:hypothetical protein
MNLFLLAALAVLSQSTPRFHAVVLETEGYVSVFDLELAVSINEAGECVGSVVDSSGGREAAYWNQAGELTVLANPGDGISPWSSAADINEDGLAIGFANLYPETIPIVWDLDTGQAATLAFPFSTWGSSVGPKSGLLLLTYTGIPPLYTTFLERDGTEHVIPGASGNALNGNRQVTGYQELPAGSRAFRWSAPVGSGSALMEFLDPPAGFVHSVGRDLDDTGAVVGLAGDQHGRAVLWSASNVPTLLPPVRPDALDSMAEAIGPQGWIVGHEWIDETANVAPYGVLWVGGAPYKLDDLLVGSPPVHVQFANDVNGAGQIVGRAIVRGVGRAVRLDPVP